MYLIDTNIHVAYLLQNFETETLTKKYLDAYNEIKLSERVISDFILGEFETFMIQVIPSKYNLNAKDKQNLKQLTLDYIDRITTHCSIITPTVQTVRVQKTFF